ncbi:MAG: DUF1800 domain-containing protein [Bacteroidetes bacterium]|nr:DUF1800 domain-containing protein [Bacteroidota bacterium]
MIREYRSYRRLYVSSALLVSLSISLPLGITPVTVAAQDQLSESDQIIHVLNRLAYGPRPGDIERVKTMGIPAYIEEQLYPETIPDARADDIINDFWIVGKNFRELADYDRPAVAGAVRRRQNVQQRAEHIDQWVASESSRYQSDQSDRALAARRSVLNSQISGRVTRLNRPPGDGELANVRLLRAVYSERQLLEIMVDFWVNHFNIFVGDLFLGTDYTQAVIRPNALGKFEDLLIATATHPAMMYYLDNWLSSAPEEIVQKRLAAGHEVYPGSSGRRALAMRTRQEYFDQASGLNENYGRELMELHTLGVDGGYTQEDVIQVAKSFTGWTVTSVKEGAPDGHFVFDPLIHEDGDKVVLGETISSGGMDEGLQILKMLARHPSTARFVSTKLVRRFVADDPPATVVDAASRAFTESGGDIREVLRAIFSSPEFFSPEHYLGKMKKPLEVVVSALRTVSAEIEPGLGAPMNYLNQTLNQMGERLYRHLAPDGYPDVASAWISTNTLFKRMDFAIVLPTGNIPGVTVDIDAAHALFQQLEFPNPTSGQLAGVQSIAQQMSENMMANEMEDGSGMAQNDMMQKSEPSSIGQEITDAGVLATVVALGSPRFQKR